MFRKALLTAISLLLPVIGFAQTKLLRYPTYSKGKVAFSYLGDIWIANENGTDVQRLTVNQARDQFPRFSPDGQWIAFSSNREGNYDVYVVAAAGGEPRQLTFNSANDDVVGWTPDGKRIIFSSTRGNGAFPTVATLWEVPVDGGIERALDTDWGAYASYSPDGAKLAFPRHPSVWSRKHYRGSYAADLWVEELATKKFTKLGDEEYHGNMLWPMYGTGGEIYFVSNELPNEPVKPGSPEVMKSVNNIWKISDKGGKPVQVTRHTDGNLFLPEHLGRRQNDRVRRQLRHLEAGYVASGKSTEIRIDIKSDYKENKTELVTITNEAEGFSLSPSNKRAAVAVHGEIFTIATDRGADAARHRDTVEGTEPALVAQREMDRVRLRPHRPGGDLHLRRAGEEHEETHGFGLRQAGDRVGVGFEVVPVDRLGPQAAANRDRFRQGRGAGVQRGRQHRRTAILARRQVDLLLAGGQPLAVARLAEGTGNGPGARDRLRPVPDLARRQVDAGRQETAGARRAGWEFGNCVDWRTRVVWVICHRIHADRKGPPGSRYQYRRAGGSGGCGGSRRQGAAGAARERLRPTCR